jgi:hypothetical protein
MYRILDSHATVDIEIRITKDESVSGALHALNTRLQIDTKNVLTQVLAIQDQPEYNLVYVRCIGKLASINAWVEKLKRLARFVA